MKALTREFGPRSPVSSEGSAKGFRKFSEWNCRTIPTIYAFGPFRLDAQGGTLFMGTEAAALSQRAVALLRILIDRAGALVTKDALIKAAWPGLAVEDSNLTVQIAALRRALGEVPGGESWIATLPRRGYRFVGPAVTKSENRVPATPTVEAATRPAPMMALALPDQPSIAVLPFENLSGDPEQGYFVDGMVEEIITALSRIRGLFVIARNSSFTYKGQAVDVKQIGRELGVRYVLEGSVRKAEGRVRITAQLIEAETATHLWADRFEGSLEDVFDLQDQVAISVAGRVEPAVRTAEIRRALDRPRHDPTAYDLYLRSLRATLSWEKNDYLEALEWLSQAIKLDDTYGPALALSAVYHNSLNQNGWVDDPEATRQKAIWFARRAVRNAGTDAATLARAAWALAYAGEDIDAAIALMAQSLHINPSLAQGWRWSGWLRLWAGFPDMAIDHLEKSLRLDPLDPARATSLPTGVAHFFARRLEQARAALLRSFHEHPNWVPTSCFLASCYAHLGQLDEAKIIIKRLRGLTPVVPPNADQWRVPEQREFYLSGLRLAMRETE